jgi:hypothetical protein
MACIAFTAPQIAQAQDQTIASNFKRDKNVSVRQRPRPDYEAAGQKTGGFTVYPRVTVDLEHNDNIYAVAAGKTDDTIWRVKPEVAIRSDWSRHALGFFAGANVIRYTDNDTENAEEYTLAGNGRIDIDRGSNVALSAQAQKLIEPRTAPTAPTASGEPVEYDLNQGSVVLTKEFNRLRVTGRVDKDFNYKDVRNNAGTGTVDQDFRDRNELYYGGKAEYAVSPDTAVYLSALGNKKDYDSGNRTSDGYVVGVGANFDISELVRGDIQVGYMKQSYDTTSYKDIDGFNAAGRVEWFPTQLTTIGVNGSRTIEESTAINSPGYVSNNIGASVDHELLRNVLLSATASYGKDAYEQIDRDDKRTNFSATATYLLNRRVGLFLTYNYLKQNSNGADKGASFKDNKLIASVALQF